MPGAVAGTDNPFSRTHDVGEQHRRQHTIGRSTTPHAREELLDFVDDDVAVRPVGQMVSARQHDETGPSEMFGQIVGMADREQARVSMQDERRGLDQRQRGPHVSSERHLQDGPCRRRTRPAPARPRPPLAKHRVPGQARCEKVHVIHGGIRRRADVQHGIEEGGQERLRDPEGVVLVPRQAPSAIEQGEGRNAARVHGCGHQCCQAAPADSEKACLSRADCVEHSEDVVDDQLDAGRNARRRRVGKSDPARVEPDEPAERGEPLFESADVGFLVTHVYGHHVAVADADEVQRAVTDGLVRDVDAVF